MDYINMIPQREDVIISGLANFNSVIVYMELVSLRDTFIPMSFLLNSRRLVGASMKHTQYKDSMAQASVERYDAECRISTLCAELECVTCKHNELKMVLEEYMTDMSEATHQMKQAHNAEKQRLQQRLCEIEQLVNNERQKV